jgi:hypothetical protein
MTRNYELSILCANVESYIVLRDGRCAFGAQVAQGYESVLWRFSDAEEIEEGTYYRVLKMGYLLPSPKYLLLF